MPWLDARNTKAA